MNTVWLGRPRAGSATVDARLLAEGNAAVAAGRAERFSAWVNEGLARQVAHDWRPQPFDAFLARHPRRRRRPGLARWRWPVSHRCPAPAGTDIAPLDEDLGRLAGTLLGSTGTRDVVAAAVVAPANDGDWILTSDPEDLCARAEATRTHVELVPT